jgi:hypothetical protein
MKIRTDFVSNSSSSSFMLVGAYFNDEEIKNAWLKLHPKDSEKFNEDSEEYDDYYTSDIVDDLADELGLRYERGIDNYYDEYCIGLTYDKMNANETRAQFEKRIMDKLNTAFKVDNVYCIVDGGYEG